MQTAVNKFGAVGLGLGLLFCAGCAATAAGSLKVDYQSAATLSNVGNLEVDVRCETPAAEPEKSKIIDAVVMRLRNLAVFKKVYSAEQASPEDIADLKLNVRVTNIKRVTKASRLWFGSMAGQGRIKANIELFDLLANIKVRQATVEGVTSIGTAFSGSTEEAIDKLAEAIAEYFQANLLNNVSVKAAGTGSGVPLPAASIGGDKAVGN